MPKFFALVAISFTLFWTPVSAQNMLGFVEKRDRTKDHHALIGVVFPAFVSPTGADIPTTSLFKDLVRFKNNSIDGGRAVGFSTAFMIDRPLQSLTHSGAVDLARRNYFQATVWGTVENYELKNAFKGVVVYPKFSYAGNYEDYRNSLDPKLDLRLENWQVTHGGLSVSVSLPSEFIELTPYVISEHLYFGFERKDLCPKQTDTNTCFKFNNPEPTRITKINYSTGSVTYKPFNKSLSPYSVNYPVELFAANEVIDYPSMFFNYARGHWTNTILRANSIVSADGSSTQMRIDAYLYMGAAQFRSGKDGTSAFEKAKALAPRSAKVSQYLIAAGLFKLKSGQISLSEWQDLALKESKIAGKWVGENELDFEQ